MHSSNANLGCTIDRDRQEENTHIYVCRTTISGACYFEALEFLRNGDMEARE
jgi:hypothetical protein